MRILILILLYFGAVAILGTAIMLAVALGIILAYDYMNKAKKNG